MRNRDLWLRCIFKIVGVVLAGMFIVKGKTLSTFFRKPNPVLAAQPPSASGDLSLRAIVESAQSADLRRPDFALCKL